MFGRPIAIALSVAATAWLLLAPPSPVEEPAFELPQLRIYFKEPPAPSFGDARPCLIDTVSCLELRRSRSRPASRPGPNAAVGRLELLEQRLAELRR